MRRRPTLAVLALNVAEVSTLPVMWWLTLLAAAPDATPAPASDPDPALLVKLGLTFPSPAPATTHPIIMSDIVS